MPPAIFLSYASQDAEFARQLCEALRAAGLEVWFDQSELRGGDAWDASIRKQIKECSLFVPIISSNTNAREEGYFRLEWKLAVDRSHLMAEDKAFFFPVVFGDIAEPSARVPEKFRERQWTRINDVSDDGAAMRGFAERIAKVQAGGASSGKSASTSPQNGDFEITRVTLNPVAPAKAGAQVLPSSQERTSLGPGLRRDDNSKSSASSEQVGTPTTLPTAAPSIAVLAFANRRASTDDEYFSDGLADELLNVLARIKGLRVAARTSAFSFKGKQATVAEIGRALNVATVLEGSVRKSGNRARVSVELVKVSDGYHLWSETYDRTLEDIFAVQDDIAQAVVKELRTTLLGRAQDATNSPSTQAGIKAEVSAAAKSRTSNTEAHRLLMQSRFLISRAGAEDLKQGVDYARQALAIDPDFAMAWTWLSRGLTFAAALGQAPVVEANEEARAAALKALELAPDLVDAHVALVWHKNMYEWDWPGAEAAIQRALQLAPDDADALASASLTFMAQGRNEQSLAYGMRSVDLDPLNQRNWRDVGQTLVAMGRHADAEAAFRKMLEFSPNSVNVRGRLALTLERQGRHAEAVAMAESESAEWARWNSLGIVHALQGNLDEADKSLTRLIANLQHRAAVQIAMNYAARKDADRAFEWLERAYVQRDSGLSFLKTNWVYESLHGDPRWMLLLKKVGLEK